MKQKTLAFISAPLVAALVLTGCSPANEQPSTAPQSTSSEAASSVDSVDSVDGASDQSTSTIASDEPEVMLGTANVAPTSDTTPELAELVIKDVRVGSHEGFDRVVFEFDGTGTPGYHAGYTDEPRQQASGMPLEVTGDAYLELMIHGTPMGMGDLESPLIQMGPMDLQAGNVQGVTHGGVFEADTQYVIGVDKQRPYSVTVLENPTRVVVDVEK
ncbi:hypothetical protein QP027_06695 [Corynebacterium breve]|uniref:AMIN-like domain-containing protein n=1 Tax=Corynebacterium breve TaxID=3049799 RepID=A0ABY8VBX3_9CORY|nr:hypothetical protein [Corynebacterium breve]WIM66822.1 hypothetical protein QP027_06695 [Corynebacterium breve]